MARQRVEKETDLGAPLRDWLQDWGWTVYAEVQLRSNDVRADIVALRNGLIWVIEIKRSASLDLLAQLRNWQHRAHYLSAAIPGWIAGRHRSIRYGEGNVFSDCLTLYGAGLLGIWPDRSVIRADSEPRWQHDAGPAEEIIAPKLHRLPEQHRDYLIARLHPEQQAYVPGSAVTEGFSTPFTRTMRQASAFVAEHPGCTVDELAAGVAHHYAGTATAKSCFLHWARSDLMAGVQVRIESRRARFYPET